MGTVFYVSRRVQNVSQLEGVTYFTSFETTTYTQKIFYVFEQTTKDELRHRVFRCSFINDGDNRPMKRVSINFTVIPFKRPPRISLSDFSLCAQLQRRKIHLSGYKNLAFFFCRKEKVEYKTIATLLLNNKCQKELLVLLRPIFQHFFFFLLNQWMRCSSFDMVLCRVIPQIHIPTFYF